ncbi:signal transduction histidine kinase [Allocatelliglobosispora scoriae]|uniref:histidine kinase n=1 Tax=Allocatelliglobosispora scoriae TaxID=643052 RepID=A0A841BYC8_9ACTN|nr:histidine kinase [Allocatelliglobosispora scoriae]MBB5872675.1 signal transduction histidine kinase [Allocatelliglobosispora scoriae]
MAKPTIRDTLLVLAVCTLDVLFFSTFGGDLGQLGDGDLSSLGLLGYAALGCVALLWRRHAPAAVFGALLLHSVLGTLLVSGYQPVLGLLVALYSVGAHAPRRFAWLIAPATGSFAVVAANEAWLRRDESNPVTTLVGLTLFYALLSTGVWALGLLAGRSRRRLADSEQRRLGEARAAVDAERQRISRELHDIVAHAVTVMVLQAAGARKVLRADPERAADALTQVEELGRQAMSELRRMLAVQGLAGHGHSGPDGAEAEHQLGLDDLSALMERVRATGVPVELVVEGRPQPVDPSVGLAAYRTVQESLTNVAKHAGGAATVTLRWSEGLRVQVTNAAPVQRPGISATLSTGHGLLGLRERVAVVGGRLDAGPTDSGGFQVTALLPAGR